MANWKVNLIKTAGNIIGSSKKVQTNPIQSIGIGGEKTAVIADTITISPINKIRSEVNNLFRTSKNLQHIELLSSAKQFIKNTSGDYELLLNLIKNEKITNSTYLNSFLKYTNENNIAILEQYLRNANSIRPCLKTEYGDLASLNFLLALNRNYSIPKNLLSDKEAQRAFINHAMDIAKKASKDNKHLFTPFGIVVEGGRRTQKSGITFSTLDKNFLNDWEELAHNRPYIKEFYKTTDEPILSCPKTVKYGDAFSINGKMYVKEHDGTITALDYSKEVFERLFPPIDRFNLQQGKLGDCYFVSLLNAMMNKPEGRNIIYKMFKGSTPNDIKISMNTGKFNGTFEEFDKEGLHLINENGFAILEQFAAFVKSYTERIPFDNLEQMMKNFRGGQTFFSSKYIIDYGSPKVINRFAIDKYAMQKLMYDKGLTREEALREIGAEKSICELLEKEMNNPQSVICFGTKGKTGEGAESCLSDKYFMYTQHGYAIKDYNSELKTVTVANPWECCANIEIPVNKLINFVSDEGIFSTSLV